jgi:hypothetical protein
MPRASRTASGSDGYERMLGFAAPRRPTRSRARGSAHAPLDVKSGSTSAKRTLGARR